MDCDLNDYKHFLDAVEQFYKGMDGLPYEPDPVAAAIAAEAYWSAVLNRVQFGNRSLMSSGPDELWSGQ